MSDNPIEHSFSRRALFAGAGTVFTSFAIPLVAGQRVPEPLQVLLPTVAYADDAEFEFDVASASQVALKVVDVNAGGKPGVKNAKIVVEAETERNLKPTLYYSVTVKTDDSGTAVIDLKDLGATPSKSLKTYKRTVDIKIYAPGCRLVSLPQVELTGKTAKALPTCSITDANKKIGYFQSVTFDGYDVLYFDSTFLFSVANDVRHSIKVKAIVRDAGECEVSIWRWRDAGRRFPGFDSDNLIKLGNKKFKLTDSEVKERQALDAKDEKAIAEGRDLEDKEWEAYEKRWLHETEVSERFLQKNSKACFKEDDRLVLRIEQNGQDTSYLMNVDFDNAPISKAGSQTYDSLPAFGGGGIQIPIPEGIPVVGGRSSFSIWTPSVPFLCEFSPLGHLLLGYGASSTSELDTDKGKNPFKDENWKEKEAKTFKEQCSEFQKEFKKNFNDYKALNKERSQADGFSKLAKAEAFGGLEFHTTGQLFALLDYDWGSNNWTGSLNAMIGVSLEGEVGAQMSIVGIPAFVALDATAEARANLAFAMISNWSSENISIGDKIWKLLSNASIKWGGSQLAITLGVEIGLTVGIGVKGVASVFARGSGAMTNYIGLADGSIAGTDDSAEYFSWPHIRFGVGADFSVGFQVWIIKYSFQIAQISAPDLFDSWGDKPSTAALGDDDDKIGTTKTGLPDEFVLSGVHTSELGDDIITVDDNGNYVVSLEDLAKNGRPATEAELAKSCEFKATGGASAAGLGDDDEDPLEVTAIPAGDEKGAIALYSFSSGDDNEDDSEDDVAAAAATLGEDEDENDAANAGGFDIEHIGGHAIDAAPGAAGVAAITEDGVVKPSVDQKILKDVYSDGRVRVINILNREILLRIATGTYNGKVRTRLVMQLRNESGQWEAPKPVDFKIKNLPDIRREDLYDYDFEVTPVGKSYFAITLLSGIRSNGAETDLLSACTQPVTSVIVCSYRGNPRAWTSWRSFDEGSKLSKNEGEYYLTYSPTLAVASVGKNTVFDTNDFFVAGSFLYKRADKDNILKDETPAHATGFIVHFAFSGLTSLKYSEMWTLPYPGTADNLTGVYLALNDRSYDAANGVDVANFVVAYETPGQCDLYLQNVTSRRDGQTRKWDCAVTVTKKCGLEGFKKIIPWPNGAYPLTAIDQNDVLCGIDTGADTPALKPLVPYDKKTDASGKEYIMPRVPGSFIFSDDGQLLLFVENKEGIDGYNYSETKDTEETYCEGRYRIKASRLVTSGGVSLFTKPFTFCEIDHPVDGISAAVMNGSASAAIITSNITSLENSLSDYFEVRVPVTACVVATELGTPGSTLFPGETVNASVTLRNTGNCQVGSVKLAIVDVDTGATVVETTEVPFNADTIVCSSEAQPNPEDATAAPIYVSGYYNELHNGSGAAFDNGAFEAHPLVAGDGRNFLKPGHEVTVTLPMAIPQDWKGSKRFRVQVSDISFANPASQSAKISWAGAAGITAACVEDGNDAGQAGVASIAALGSEVMDAACKPYADDTVVDVQFEEKAEGDLNRVALPQVLTAGGKIDDTDQDDSGSSSGNNSGSGSGSNSGGGSSSNGGSNGGSKGKKGKGGLADTGDRNNAASVGILGAVALAAGAGLAAYSRRREQIAAEATVADAEDSTDEEA